MNSPTDIVCPVCKSIDARCYTKLPDGRLFAMPMLHVGRVRAAAPPGASGDTSPGFRSTPPPTLPALPSGDPLFDWAAEYDGPEDFQADAMAYSRDPRIGDSP